MQIDIQARNFSLTEALQRYVIKRINSALTSSNDSVQRIIVRLSNANGPKGGADKRCHIQVVIPHQSDVIIDDVEANMYAAVDNATDRAGRTVTRHVAKHRKFKRVFNSANAVTAEI
ncbi:MAG: HPF/RaiA family ribosome-associated protein [Methylobacter sp.]|jgi:ribosome hibernation promoting factor|uniref:HPF/RaiA family ribosome-associated protein n=1 Tax=Methylobacter TaxID=429 RepID=UPI00035FCB57|nr:MULTISPECIES: HPF/RaiA family ribosome-associated protein [Methylobacter]MCL7420191.1 HPF/RaiA family ribosome-associated protein [Methylobacter sp.]